MEEPLSADCFWMGDEKPPYEGLKPLKEQNCSGCRLLLVSGSSDPETVSRSINELNGAAPAWLVYAPESRTVRWLKAGASGFIPAGTSRVTALATLEGVAGLVESAETRNPLTGLPGNRMIEQILNSQVIQGDALAAYFDISGFKPFNDYYGFSRGDAVLRSLASILKENLKEYFVGHIGGDDFIAVGGDDGFEAAVRHAARVFAGRAGGFYNNSDHAAGGIEALDREGVFRFYPIMDLTVSVVDGEGCSTVEELACRAGREKKRIKGELLPDTVDSFLAGEGRCSRYSDFSQWIEDSRPDINEIKALIESAGILGDTNMADCLVEILAMESNYRIRKSAARALGKIAAEESASALATAVKDDNPHVRTAATLALPFVTGERAGPVLKEALSDSSTWVRRAALRGLGVSGWNGAAEILKKALRHDGGGKYWLNHRQELKSALQGAAFLGDQSLAGSVARILEHNPGVSKQVIWRTLLTLGGSVCAEHLLKAVKAGKHYDFVQQLDSLDPQSLPSGYTERVQQALYCIGFRRREDRTAVLRFLQRCADPLPADLSRRLRGRAVSTGDTAEFETLMDTLRKREVVPEEGDVSKILNRITEGHLKPDARGTVSFLKWLSTGSCSISRTFLEKLLRHQSREVRTAAARTVISLTRRRRHKSY